MSKDRRGKRKPMPKAKISPYTHFKLYNMEEHRLVLKAEHELIACFFAAVRKSEGFGAERMQRVYDEMMNMYECIELRIVTYRELEKQMDIETHLDMNIEEARKRRLKLDRLGQLQDVATVRASDLFLWALHESEGFGNERLHRVYGYAAKICQDVMDGKTTYEDCYAEVKKAGFDYHVTKVF